MIHLRKEGETKSGRGREKDTSQRVLVLKHFLPAYREPSVQHSQICEILVKARFCKTKLMVQNRISQILGKVKLFNLFEKCYLMARTRNAKYHREVFGYDIIC